MDNIIDVRLTRPVVYELEQDVGWLSRILKDGITEDGYEITVAAFRDPNKATTNKEKNITLTVILRLQG